jgi:hypothetical protein
VDLTCAPADEAAMRALILRHLPLHGLHLSELTAATGEDGVTLGAVVQGEGVTDSAMEQAIARLGAEAGIRRLRWLAIEEA